MDATTEIGRNFVSKYQIQPGLSVENEQADAGRRPDPSRETKFSGADGDREI